jgi:hypothetical protein
MARHLYMHNLGVPPMAGADNNREALLLEDADLLALPARPLTPRTLFVCTYVAKLDNLHIDFVKLTEIMCANPHGPLVAVNSNFGHACRPGYEHLLKTPKPPPPERRMPARPARLGRPRRVQGDGTCFNSAVEPTLAIDHPAISADKTYKCKCFSTTGEVQVPGVISPDLSDGRAVVKALVDYLNELNVGDVEAPAGEAPAGEAPAGEAPAGEAPAGEAPAGEPRRLKITVINEQPKMLNDKFSVNCSSPRLLINLHALAAYMQKLELAKAVEGMDLTDELVESFAGWPSIILPPYPVRETKAPTDDVKVSFRFHGANRAPRINIFQKGKINILGADSTESSQRIYDFFVQLFTGNWARLVCLQPRRDIERQVARTIRGCAEPLGGAEMAQQPIRLTDAEVDALLGVIFAETPADETPTDGAPANIPADETPANIPADKTPANIPADETPANETPADKSISPDAVQNIIANLGEWQFDGEDDDTAMP